MPACRKTKTNSENSSTDPHWDPPSLCTAIPRENEAWWAAQLTLEACVSNIGEHTQTMILLFLTSISVYPELVGFTADYYDPDYKEKTPGGKLEAKKSVGGGKNYNLWPETQCNILNLDFMFNAFDDQYKGCEEVLETDVMPKILTLEKSMNLPFGAAWNRAEEQWNRLKPKLRIPPGFQDEFGVAITVYTTDWPEGDPIYKAFNRNVSLAGKSREDYMLSFHYKALHFYITRALQLMKKNSRKRHTAYRGTDKTFEVSETVLRFGRFTSSSLNIEVAKAYHGGLFFEITTCFGVDIHKISSYPKEQEVLIPVAEKFHYVKKEGSFYILNSTCELCSYFNCAYLGEALRGQHPLLDTWPYRRLHSHHLSSRGGGPSPPGTSDVS